MNHYSKDGCLNLLTNDSEILKQGKNPFLLVKFKLPMFGKDKAYKKWMERMKDTFDYWNKQGLNVIPVCDGIEVSILLPKRD